MAAINIDVPELFRLYNDPSIPTTELCRMLNISNGSLHRLRMRYGLPLRPAQPCNRRHDDPTPEEIEERAAECRARRSPNEKARMERSGLVRWTMPTYSYDGRDCAFMGTNY